MSTAEKTKISKDTLISRLLSDTNLDKDSPKQVNDDPFKQILSFDEVDDRINEFKGDDLVKDAFTQGLDLREYAKTIEEELHGIEQMQLLNCKNIKKKKTCDNILGEMGEMLTGFQTDLFQISAEIETLQNKSRLLSTRLKNRTDIELKLHNVLEGIVVGPDLIKKICEGEVNEFFLLHLAELNAKMTFVKNQQANKIFSLKEVGPELERLRLKALLKGFGCLPARSSPALDPEANSFTFYVDCYGEDLVQSDDETIR
ncbi:Histone acetyltransferase kat2b [Clydaea vesicula]|uniref:Histone acetyltransferase kat2b n=1 Tax=Clydaea vesicula TaxID=447962 RepID=A0AAD5TUU0_9FUNG|nr:Histone acetyltransferase kat2b [Clydaea vesicula]